MGVFQGLLIHLVLFILFTSVPEEEVNSTLIKCTDYTKLEGAARPEK